MISKSSIACCLYLSPSIIAPSPEVKQRVFLPHSNRVWRSPDGRHNRKRPRENRSFCCIALGLLLAQSGHPSSHQQCPLLGGKRTSIGPDAMSVSDPKRKCHAAATEASVPRLMEHCGENEVLGAGAR